MGAHLASHTPNFDSSGLGKTPVLVAGYLGDHSTIPNYILIFEKKAPGIYGIYCKMGEAVHEDKSPVTLKGVMTFTGIMNLC